MAHPAAGRGQRRVAPGVLSPMLAKTTSMNGAFYLAPVGGDRRWSADLRSLGGDPVALSGTGSVASLQS